MDFYSKKITQDTCLRCPNESHDKLHRTESLVTSNHDWDNEVFPVKAACRENVSINTVLQRKEGVP